MNPSPPSAGEAGASWLEPAFLDRLRALFLRLRKRRQLRRKGVQATPATGFTREFKDFRHYTRSDDYRAIDWRLYARLERLFVRLYEEVQEFNVHVVVDTSASMAAPFPDKRIHALRLAAALSYLGLVSQHRVCLYAMSDRVVNQLAPVKGQGGIRKVLDSLDQLEFGGATDLERCFSEFRPPRQRYGIIFVISDFFGREVGTASRALQRCANWPGESHFIQLAHPRERDPGLEGEVELVDVETGEHRRLWFTRRDMERYRRVFTAFETELARGCLSRQIDHLSWQTDQSFEDQFVELLSRGSALAQG